MQYINKFFIVLILVSLAVCGIGTVFPYHKGFYFMNSKLFNYLLLIILINFIFVFLKRQLVFYKAISLVLSLFAALFSFKMDLIHRLNIYLSIVCGMFTIVFWLYYKLYNNKKYYIK